MERIRKVGFRNLQKFPCVLQILLQLVIFKKIPLICYRTLKKYISRFYRGVNPGTQIGLPGRFQGLNTGVALYNFAHLRSNVKFNEYITLKGRNLPDLDQLAAKFLFKSHLGDQCFFTLLSLEHPDLFRILDCGYNFQLDESMFRDPWESRFYAYHNCTSKPKVYHMNGGSEILSGARLLAD